MFSPLTNPNTQVGLVPLGGIVPIAANLSGAFPLPASGVVLNGWMRADGASIPAGNVLSGTAPDLTGGKFIYGTSGAGAGANPAAGATGGAGTVTLAIGNLPTGTIGTCTPSGSASVGSLTAAAQAWTYGANSGVALGQVWTWSGAGSTSGPSSGMPNGGTGNSAANPGQYINAQWTNGTLGATASSAGIGVHTHSLSGITGSNNNSTVTSVTGSNASSAVTGTINFTGSSTNVTSSGSGAAFAILPPYVAAVYLLRVS